MDSQKEGMRLLANEPETWETILMSVILFFMFVGLISDRVAPDHVFMTALALCMVTGIITISQGLAGFSNEGVLTVMVLFVVAHGLTVTGAIDWYIGKLLGTPKSSAGAQLRLLVPVVLVSGFLNNTPIVALMIPIVLRWARTIRISVSQLLIPLSYGAIIGGTLTLIGTSTNLVVSGLLMDAYPNDPSAVIGLFEITPYGVPAALIGVAYIILFGEILLPGGKSGDGGSPLDGDEILLGARITLWSPAAGRSVKRSGLRDTGGLYLVSVRRAATGNIHRAVGQEFVLDVGDVVFFSGLIEGFGEFCSKHGLEMVTSDSLDDKNATTEAKIATNNNISTTRALSDEAESLRIINLMSDIIHGQIDFATFQIENPAQIAIATESRSGHGLILIGVNVPDRPGLLLDFCKGLLRLNLQVHRTEAVVVGERSVSVWRCDYLEKTETDREKISAVLSALLETDNNDSAEVFKKQGLKVIRVKVTKNSRLVGNTAAEVHFRESYKAAIVAVQQGGKNAVKNLSSLKFGAGDILVLQVSDDSPLLSSDHFGADENTSPSTMERSDIEAAAGGHATDEAKAFKKDFVVLPTLHGDTQGSKEFLVAMRISPKSNLSKKNIAENGITQVPGVYVVSIERPVQKNGIVVFSGDTSTIESQLQNDYNPIAPDEPLEDGDILWFAGGASALGDLRKIPGLESPEQEEIKQMNENVHNRRLVQAVIAKSGPLVGKTVREIGFRTKYGAAVLSVHREGNRVHDHPGNIKLLAGDILLLDAGPTFIKRTADDDRAFALLAEVKDSAPPRLRYLIPALIILVAMLTVTVFGFETAPLLVCGLFAAIIMVTIGLLSPQEARDAIDWSLYVAIAAAFGISKALENSGVAKGVATFLLTVGESIGIGDAGIIGTVYFTTTLISAFVTNNAAAALMFPIAIDAAEGAGINVKIMSYAVMLGASDYTTPFGYQTNLMVYGPGGYKALDYLKFGFPLQVVLWLVSTWVLSVPSVMWYVNCLITFIILVVVAVGRLAGGSVFRRLKRGVNQNHVE